MKTFQPRDSIKFHLEKYDGEIIVKDRIKGDYTKGSKFLVLIPEHNEISKKNRR